MHNDFHSKNTNLHDVTIFCYLRAQFIIICGLADSILNYKLCFTTLTYWNASQCSLSCPPKQWKKLRFIYKNEMQIASQKHVNSSKIFFFDLHILLFIVKCLTLKYYLLIVASLDMVTIFSNFYFSTFNIYITLLRYF